MKIAVIGAGLAGLTAASELSGFGFDVTVFDKARGPSGRMSTRRTDGRSFDHGAPYFTARAPAFRARVESWMAKGLVDRWDARWVHLTEAGSAPVEDDVDRFVGVPRMSALCRALSEGFETRFGVRIERAGRAARPPFVASIARSG